MITPTFARYFTSQWKFSYGIKAAALAALMTFTSQAFSQNVNVVPPCEVQVVVQGGGANTKKKVPLSTIDPTLDRYWKTNKSTRAVKLAYIKKILSLKKGLGFQNVEPDPCDPGNPGGGCSAGIPGISSQSVCPGPQQLYAYPVGGNTAKWYYSSSGGSAFFQGPVYEVNLYGAVTYYVSSFDESTGCESARKQVNITMLASFNLHEFIVAGTVADVTALYCPSTLETFPSLTLTTSTKSMLYRIRYNGTIIPALDKTGPGPVSNQPILWTGEELNDYLNTSVTTHVYQVIAISGACSMEMENTVTISAYPVTNFTLTGGGTFCGRATLALGGVGGQENILYQLVKDGVNIDDVKIYEGTPVSWPDIAESGSYKVIAKHVSCPATTVETAPVSLTINPMPVAEILGPEAVCTGSATLTATTGTGYGYEWRLEGQPALLATNVTSLNVTAAGTYELKTILGSCFSFDTHTINVSTPPTNPITGILGLLSNLPDEASLLEVVGGTDATRFDISIPVIDASGSVPNRKFELSLSASNPSIIVTPIKNGCAGTTYSFGFTVLNPTGMTNPLVLKPTGTSSGYINLPLHSKNNYQGCINSYGPVTITSKLDLGDNYDFGTLAFTGTPTATISVYSEGSATPQIYTVNFSISNTQPEQVYINKITTSPELIKFIHVSISGTTTQTATTNALRLTTTVEEQDQIGINKVSLKLFPPTGSGWEQTFTWESSCYEGKEIPNYVVQLLRSYDNNDVAGSGEGLVAPTDWSQALSIETESSFTSLKLAMAEGSGRYWWRVIPIGNKSNGNGSGIANPENWGTPSVPQSFFYTHPEEDVNWIYQRTYLEGNRMGENVTYANGLLQVRQEQQHNPGDKVIATQTLQDFVGRNALMSLPIPTAASSLGYIGNLLRTTGPTPMNYSASHFDLDGTITAPEEAIDIDAYYSGSDAATQINGVAFNKGVPSAQKYPYTRTVFGPDGKPREEAGVGLKHSMVGGKTVKTYYSTPAESELVQIFGAEAPDAIAVQRITTVDENGTASVQYMAKENKLLATAMETRGTVTNPTLAPLPSQTPATKELYEEIRNYERLDDSTIVSRKALFFVKPETVITVTYEMLPGLLNELCGASPGIDVICKTCDYKVSIVLFREGVTQPELLASHKFSAGDCSEQSSLGWNTSAQATLIGGVKYTLEKRIQLLANKTAQTTYLDSHLQEIKDKYTELFETNGHLQEIHDYLNPQAPSVPDLTALKTYLAPFYVSAERHYAVPVGADQTCQEYIYIPEFDDCPQPVETFDANCKRNGTESFFDYFVNYYTGSGLTLFADEDYDQVVDAVFLYFNNQHTKKKNYFTKATFDQMVSNMIADNGLTCSNVWKVWKQSVQDYEVNIKLALDPATDINSNEPNMDGENGNYHDDLDDFSTVTSRKYSLFESFMQNIEADLQNAMPANVDDICTNRPYLANPYFIKKGVLYGKFSGLLTSNYFAGFLTTNVVMSGVLVATSATAPDLTQAHRLIYYDFGIREMRNALKLYTGLTTNETTEPTLVNFNSMSDCDKYRLFKQTASGAQDLSEPDGLRNIQRLRNDCGNGCQKRKEEFRQKIIQALMAQNSSYSIEHYYTYINPALDANPDPLVTSPYWVGIYDPTKNNTGFTMSECDLDAMVDALIKNCINNYCNTPLTVHDEQYPGKPAGIKVRVYGTDAERLKIEKALTYDFEVQLKSIGASCSAGYDNVNPITTVPNSSSVNLAAGFSWGEILGPPSNPKNFDMVYTVTNTNSSGAGSLKQAIADANLYGNPFAIGTDRTRKILIQFNISGTLPRTISVVGADLQIYADNVTIDGTTQPGFNRLNGPAIIISRAATANLADDSIFELFNNTTIKGLELRSQSSSSQFPCAGISLGGSGDAFSPNRQSAKIIGNVIRVLSTASGSKDNTGIGAGGGDNIRSVEIKGNIIGSNYSLSINDIATTLYGIHVTSWNTTIGGPTLAEANIINGRFAILLNTYAGGKVINNRILNYYYDAIFNEAAGSPVQYSKNLARQYNISPAPTNEPRHPDHPAAWYKHGYIYHYPVPPYNAMPARVLPTPVITSVNQGCYGSAVGTAVANSTIELFTVQVDAVGEDDVLVYLGSVLTDKNGQWSAANLPLETGKYLGAVASMATRTSSEMAKSAVISGTPSWLRGMCFKFTTQRPGVTIPSEMTGNVYNPVAPACTDENANKIKLAIQQQVEKLIDARVKTFRKRYFTQCGDPSNIQDKLSIKYVTGLHQYTLYYYDRAGNLIRTVPPEGVDVLPIQNADELAAAKLKVPRHLMVTEYQYNSLKQIIREHTPDGSPKPNNLTERPGASATPSDLESDTYYSSNIYNSLGQLRFSRNTSQKVTGKYGYTKYDELGRVIEIGEASGYNYMELYAKRDEKGSGAFPIDVLTLKHVTRSFYTSSYPSSLPLGYTQRNLLNQISYMVYDEDPNPSSVNDETTSIYSYDSHGNVEWVVQDIPGLGKRGIKYEYNLLRQQITKISYSPGNADQFFHRFEYDPSGRILASYTSNDESQWTREAKYAYYLHGPLKRTILGEDEVQGIDYTYTIHGWIKMINHPIMDKLKDAGQDGNTGSVVGRDVFGMALGYYASDFINAGVVTTGVSPVNATVKDLYNGNVSTWSTNVGEWATGYSQQKKLVGYVYEYDELNRLKTGTMHTGSTFLPTTDFSVQYTYATDQDPLNVLSNASNGNIYTAKVRTYTGILFDDLAYRYPTYMDALNNNKVGLLSNRLQQVEDFASGTTTSTYEDVEPSQTTTNYIYDEIGNLIHDKQQLRKIDWTPFGKVKKVRTVNGSGGDTGPNLQFFYDAHGNRVLKRQVNAANQITNTYYVRGADGQVMAVYEQVSPSGTTGSISTKELVIYGNGRLGLYRKPELLTGTYAAPGNKIYTRLLDKRVYQLKDHLGNVRSVITDRKLSTVPAGGTPHTFLPQVVGLFNYYPFGMEQPGRNYTTGDRYRYGFNGKEKDLSTDWGGSTSGTTATGSSMYDYGFRIYNPSLGRFLSTDPLMKSYPMLTSYQFASNTPIQAIDLDGLEQQRVVRSGGFTSDGYWDSGSDNHIEVQSAAKLRAQISPASGDKTVQNYGPYIDLASQLASTMNDAYPYHIKYPTTGGNLKTIIKGPNLGFRSIGGPYRSPRAEQFAIKSNVISGTALGLNYLSTGYGWYQVYNQYNDPAGGGWANVSKYDLAQTTIGTVGTTASTFSAFGIGGATTIGIGTVSSFAGIALAEGYMMYSCLKSMNDMRLLPYSDDANVNQHMQDLWNNGVYSEADLFNDY